MNNKETNCNSIFKSTFLFGFVQLINILVKVVLNKFVALLMGASGMGIIGLFNSTIGTMKTGAGLGISQSAVKDISEAKEIGNFKKFSQTINTVNKIILFTSFLGLFVTILLSHKLSLWIFENNDYYYSFLFLSLAVAFTILWEGQLSILKGVRRLRLLAKANIFGALSGLVFAIPLYYIYKIKGIIPVLIITPLVSYLFSSYYVRKVKYKKIKLSFKKVFSNSSSMVKMGISLAFATFLGNISIFLFSAYLSSKEDGLIDLGYYNAGVMIMIGYFSVIINALTTDYYPRISAINKDNKKLEIELNKQSLVSLFLSFPLIVLFLFLLPVLVQVLYSKEFFPMMDFVRIGIYGTIITICSNQIDLILVAKGETKTFTIVAIFFRIFELSMLVILYEIYGLIGAGIAILIHGILHLIVMTIIVRFKYAIKFSSTFIKSCAMVIIIIGFASYISTVNSEIIKYSIGVVLCVLSLCISFYYSKNMLGLDLLKIISKK